MKIEINNLSDTDANEIVNIFNSWKDIKTKSDFSRWCSVFVNVSNIDNIINTELKITDE